jgi:hypothetical protein
MLRGPGRSTGCTILAVSRIRNYHWPGETTVSTLLFPAAQGVDRAFLSKFVSYFYISGCREWTG